VIGVYQVCPVKKVTGDDPVNQACPDIPVYPVFQAQEDQKVYLVVMDVTEQKENRHEEELVDRTVVPVNLVFLDKEVQKVNLHKLYLDSKAKSDHPELPVFLVVQGLPEILVFPAILVLLVSLDVKVLKEIVVNQVFQVVLELDLLVIKVKKESQDHLLPIHSKV